jgi:tRNA-binding EMAP/Myf-like protein
MNNEEFRAAPIKPLVSFADLEKIDIRVGTITAVEDVSGSNKLVRLIVDFGITAETFWRELSRSVLTRATSKAHKRYSSSIWSLRK